MPSSEQQEKQALTQMYRAIRRAKTREDGDEVCAEVMDYMAEVAEQVAAKARERRNQPGDTFYSEFAVGVAKLVTDLV